MTSDDCLEIKESKKYDRKNLLKKVSLFGKFVFLEVLEIVH